MGRSQRGDVESRLRPCRSVGRVGVYHAADPLEGAVERQVGRCVGRRRSDPSTTLPSRSTTTMSSAFRASYSTPPRLDDDPSARAVDGRDIAPREDNQTVTYQIRGSLREPLLSDFPASFAFYSVVFPPRLRPNESGSALGVTKTFVFVFRIIRLLSFRHCVLWARLRFYPAIRFPVDRRCRRGNLLFRAEVAARTVSAAGGELPVRCAEVRQTYYFLFL